MGSTGGYRVGVLLLSTLPWVYPVPLMSASDAADPGNGGTLREMMLWAQLCEKCCVRAAGEPLLVNVVREDEE